MQAAMPTSDPPRPEPRPAPPADDSALMLAVRDGDVTRLGELFERHHRRLYAFCLRLTGNPATAEDLVQEAFCRILRYRHTFRDDGDFLVWAYRLTRNVCADFFRKAGNRPSVALEDAEPGGEPPSDAPSPAERLQSAESRSLLRAALARLPVDKRELLLLARFEGLRYAQIGELLGCSTGAVKVRVHRAVRALGDCYRSLADEVNP